MVVPVVPRIGSGVPLWNLLQSEPFGSSEAYATVGVAAAAVLVLVGVNELAAEDEDTAAGAAEAYVASATKGVIANNIIFSVEFVEVLECRRLQDY